MTRSVLAVTAMAVALLAGAALLLWAASAALAQTQAQSQPQRPTRSRRSRNSPGSSSSSRTPSRTSTSGSRRSTAVGRPLDRCRTRPQGDRGAARARRHGARRGLRQWRRVPARRARRSRMPARSCGRCEQDTRFRPEERQFLTEQWRRLRDRDRARHRGAGDRAQGIRRAAARRCRRMRTSSTSSCRSAQAQKALEVIQRLTQDIREASDQLKKLIGGIKPPGA